jgi:bacterioferritin-associated ferredoxin
MAGRRMALVSDEAAHDASEVDLMFVCLCLAVTNQVVRNAVQNGARTSQQVATACGAGSDCGRCRRTLRAIIASASAGEPTPDNRQSANEFACAATHLK